MKFIWLLMIGCLTAVGVSADSAGSGPRTQKMCWAHYVSWGFDLVGGYDRVMIDNERHALAPYNDRSLLGRYVQERSGIYYGTQKQIDCARLWGIDGFCVDVIGHPSIYCDVMNRFFRAAEGTDFKVALCIDSIQGTVDEVVTHLGNFIKKYQNHPNACLIDGKMVIFAYNIAGKSLEELQQIRSRLKEKGLDAFYLIQPMRETTMWDSPERLREVATVAEGFYDFGCNGFSPKQMIARLRNGRASLRKLLPGGILCAGIAQGYVGQGSGYYRPYLNTGSLRHSWEAAIANDADWVCLTTWNDYVEHTQFEPTAVNRDTLLRINREYLRQWRKKAAPRRPAEVIVSYREELVAGDDLTLELLSFSYSTAPVEARLRLLNLDGSVLQEYSRTLPPEKMSVFTFRLPPEKLGAKTALRVQIAMVSGDGKVNWNELYPIRRRPDRMATVRTVRCSTQGLISVPVSLELTGEKAKISLKTWLFAGKLELLRDGYPIYEQEISHEKKPVWSCEVPLPAGVAPVEGYVVRLTDVSDRIAFSNPAYRAVSDQTEMISQPVIVTGGDFDEVWPLWSDPPRTIRNRVKMMTFPRRDYFQIRYDFDKEAKLLRSTGSWATGAILGRMNRHWWYAEEYATPKWIKAAGPDGTERTMLQFDGDDNVTVAVRCFPFGPVTLEMLVSVDEAGTLFDVAGTSLALDGTLRPVFTRAPESKTSATLVGKLPLRAGSWHHLAAVYTGDGLRLYLDGKSIGEKPAPAQTMGVNAIPTIGCRVGNVAGFKGRMAGFALYGGIPERGKFLLPLPRTQK